MARATSGMTATWEVKEAEGAHGEGCGHVAQGTRPASEREGHHASQSLAVCMAARREADLPSRCCRQARRGGYRGRPQAGSRKQQGVDAFLSAALVGGRGEVVVRR